MPETIRLDITAEDAERIIDTLREAAEGFDVTEEGGAMRDLAQTIEDALNEQVNQ